MTVGVVTKSIGPNLKNNTPVVSMMEYQPVLQPVVRFMTVAIVQVSVSDTTTSSECRYVSSLIVVS